MPATRSGGSSIAASAPARASARAAKPGKKPGPKTTGRKGRRAAVLDKGVCCPQGNEKNNLDGTHFQSLRRIPFRHSPGVRVSRCCTIGAALAQLGPRVILESVLNPTSCIFEFVIVAPRSRPVASHVRCRRRGCTARRRRRRRHRRHRSAAAASNQRGRADGTGRRCDHHRRRNPPGKFTPQKYKIPARPRAATAADAPLASRMLGPSPLSVHGRTPSSARDDRRAANLLPPQRASRPSGRPPDTRAAWGLAPCIRQQHRAQLVGPPALLTSSGGSSSMRMTTC